MVRQEPRQRDQRQTERKPNKAVVPATQDQRADTECELSQTFHIENFRHEIEEYIDGAEAVLDEISGLDLEPQIPVIIEEALNRCQRDQRKSIQEQHVVVIPSVDAREVLKEDQEGHKTAEIGHDHADGGDHEVSTVTHLALQILYQDLSVDTKIEPEPSSLLLFCYGSITHFFISIHCFSHLGISRR